MDHVQDWGLNKLNGRIGGFGSFVHEDVNVNRLC
jgi:hypothetical protein